jgi:predicted phosphoribosyltransferase
MTTGSLSAAATRMIDVIIIDGGCETGYAAASDTHSSARSEELVAAPARPVHKDGYLLECARLSVRYLVYFSCFNAVSVHQQMHT